MFLTAPTPILKLRFLFFALTLTVILGGPSCKETGLGVKVKPKIGCVIRDTNCKLLAQPPIWEVWPTLDMINDDETYSLSEILHFLKDIRDCLAMLCFGDKAFLGLISLCLALTLLFNSRMDMWCGKYRIMLVMEGSCELCYMESTRLWMLIQVQSRGTSLLNLIECIFCTLVLSFWLLCYVKLFQAMRCIILRECNHH